MKPISVALVAHIPTVMITRSPMTDNHPLIPREIPRTPSQVAEETVEELQEKKKMRIPKKAIATEEIYAICLSQIGQKYDIEKEAILTVVTRNAVLEGVNNPKIDAYKSESKKGPVTITGPKSTMEAAFRSGEFIVASTARTRERETIEVELEAEIWPVNDPTAKRYNRVAERAKKEVRNLKLEASVHISMRPDVRALANAQERHFRRAWELAGYTVIKCDWARVKLADGTTTLTRTDVVHLNVIPDRASGVVGGQPFGALWPMTITVEYEAGNRRVSDEMPYVLHADQYGPPFSNNICGTCHKYFESAIAGHPGMHRDAMACMGHQGKGLGGKGAGGKGAGGKGAGGKGGGRQDGTAVLLQQVKTQMAKEAEASASADLLPCKHFHEGTCMRAVEGRTCGFAHMGDPKMICCRHGQKGGTCRYKDKCLYSSRVEWAALPEGQRVALDATGPSTTPDGDGAMLL